MARSAASLGAVCLGLLLASALVDARYLFFTNKELFHTRIDYIITRKEPTQARKYFMIVNLPLFCI